jgi:hypothetical protein
MLVCAKQDFFRIAANVWNVRKSWQIVAHVRKLAEMWNARLAGQVHTRRMPPHVHYVILLFWAVIHAPINLLVRVASKNISSIKVVISAWIALRTVAPVTVQRAAMFAILDITEMGRIVRFAVSIVWNASVIQHVLYAKRDTILALTHWGQKLVSLVHKVASNALSKTPAVNVWKTTILTGNSRNALSAAISHIAKLAIFRESASNALHKNIIWAPGNASRAGQQTTTVMLVLNQVIIALFVTINFTQFKVNASHVGNWSRVALTAHRKILVLPACLINIYLIPLLTSVILVTMFTPDVIFVQ